MIGAMAGGLTGLLAIASIKPYKIKETYEVANRYNQLRQKLEDIIRFKRTINGESYTPACIENANKVNSNNDRAHRYFYYSYIMQQGL